MRNKWTLADILYAVLLLYLLLPGDVLDFAYPYSNPGGTPLLKIHPASYLLMLALGVKLMFDHPTAFIASQLKSNGWAAQFFLAVMTIAMIGLLKYGVGGLAYLVDTLAMAAIVIMLLAHISPERRYRISAMVLTVVFINSLVAIAEFLAKTHLLPHGALGGSDYFRATAFFGHPLANALITVPTLPLLFAMPWSGIRKTTYSGAYIVSLLAFGTRGGFAVGTFNLAASLLVYGSILVRRKKIRISTLLLATQFIFLLAGGVLAFLVLGTEFGARLVGRAYIDDSAETRIEIFRIFDFLSFAQIWSGIQQNGVLLLREKYTFFRYLENFWVIMLISMGIPMFVVFSCSLLWFLYGLRSAQNGLLTLAAISFIILASGNNSLSTKTPALTIFAATVYGLRRPRASDDGARHGQAFHGQAGTYGC